MERDNPQQRGRQSDPSRMDPMDPSSGQQGQQGQWGQGQGQWERGQDPSSGQKGQWGQSQGQSIPSQEPGAYGYGRDDDFSPSQEMGESEYGTRSGVGSGTTAPAGASRDYDASQYERAQAGGDPSQQHKPSMGQRMMGSAEKAFGKMTGDQEKMQKGEQRKSGERR